MNPTLKRSSLSLAAAALSFASWPVMAECVVDTYEFAIGKSIEARLSTHLTAHIQKPDEEEFRLTVFKDTAEIFSYIYDINSEPRYVRGAPQIIATDINNDGIKELLIGTGEGMANSYYWMLMPMKNGKWHLFDDISDPEFCRTDSGYTTAARSGQRWTETYWAIGTDGTPYRKISQTIVDEGIVHRVVYNPKGRIVSQAIASEDHDIFASPPRYMARVSPDGNSVPVYKSPEGNREVTRLKANAPVELVGVDNFYSMFRVEYGNGKRGWIMLEDISYK